MALSEIVNFIGVVLFFMLMAWVLFCKIFRQGRGFGYEPNKPRKTLFVLGSGGHTSELTKLRKTMSPEDYCPRIYVSAHTDSFSPEWLESLEGYFRENVIFETVHRAREVGQSWMSTVFYSLPISILQSLRVYLKHRPTVIMTNGPGICVPFMFVAWFFKTLCLWDCEVVYIESVCRVHTLSLSGRLALGFADVLIVQWPELFNEYKCYPKVKYMGRLT